MALMKRRHFLQSAAATLATLGMSQWDVMRQGDRYAKVLAQSTPRKLALLVGINAYPFGNDLRGCLTDVDLQRELLIHRFGFKDADIHVLRDQAATRQGILDAFSEHLIKQAKPGDVVVFHFSGHGSLISDPLCIYQGQDIHNQKACLNATFLPIDHALSLRDRQNGGVVLDITGHTLFLLRSLLKTEAVTVVLDSCHSGGGKRGNLTIRAETGGSQLKASPAELAYQKQLLSQLNWKPEEYQKQLQTGGKGVIIAAAGIDQFAADTTFNDFHAGAFTYTLTQYLWQQTGDDPFQSAIANIGRTTQRISQTKQIPESEVEPGSHADRQPIYFVNSSAPPAEAVIQQVNGNEVDIWLGGIDPEQAITYSNGAVFELVDKHGKPQGQIKLKPNSRNGLQVKGELVKGQASSSLAPGGLLQELIAGIPSPEQLKLNLGLDDSLGKDMTAAKTALQSIDRLTVVPLQQNQEVHYILARMTETRRQELQRQPDAVLSSYTKANLPPVGSIGIFTPGLVELIPDSFGQANEPVAAAVNRLQAKFKSLLAAHITKLILNPGSSRLNVTATMTQAGSQNQVLAHAFTARGSVNKEQGTANTPPTSPDDQHLVEGTPIQVVVTNHEATNLYMSLLVIDPTGEMGLLFPNRYTAGDEEMVVEAGQTLRIPDPDRGERFVLRVRPPFGTVEILVIASASPLHKVVRTLQEVAARGKEGLGDDPAEIANNLLDDLNQGTRGKAGGLAVELPAGVRGVDANQLAALSLTFESIPKT